jgi:hypothetical protein
LPIANQQAQLVKKLKARRKKSSTKLQRLTATSLSVAVGKRIKFMNKHLLPISILLEAKLMYFGDQAKASRHRENVMERQAFANAFIKRAKTVDIAAVIGRNHATVVHYRKNHSSDIKYNEEYQKAFERALMVYEQYNEKANEGEFLGFDIPQLLRLTKDLKNRIQKQEVVIYDQQKEIDRLKAAIASLTV